MLIFKQNIKFMNKLIKFRITTLFKLIFFVLYQNANKFLINSFSLGKAQTTKFNDKSSEISSKGECFKQMHLQLQKEFR